LNGAENNDICLVGSFYCSTLYSHSCNGWDIITLFHQTGEMHSFTFHRDTSLL